MLLTRINSFFVRFQIFNVKKAICFKMPALYRICVPKLPYIEPLGLENPHLVTNKVFVSAEVHDYHDTIGRTTHRIKPSNPTSILTVVFHFGFFCVLWYILINNFIRVEVFLFIFTAALAVWVVPLAAMAGRPNIDERGETSSGGEFLTEWLGATSGKDDSSSYHEALWFKTWGKVLTLNLLWTNNS